MIIIYVRLIFILNLINYQVFIILFYGIKMDGLNYLWNFDIILFFVIVLMWGMGFRLADVFWIVIIFFCWIVIKKV
jgi:hypothetical protein